MPSWVRERKDLRVYQSRLAEKIKELLAITLWLDMGLGKTGIVLTAVVDLLNHFEVDRVLVVAPLRVAENTWPDEIKTWEHTHRITYTVLTGTASERESARRQLTDIHIVNSENFGWLVDRWGEAWPYDMVIFDDVTGLKEGRRRNKPGKKETEAAELACRKAKGGLTRFSYAVLARKQCSRVVILTGTPTPNGLTDLWGQAYVLDQGKRLMSSRSAFLKRWFIPDYMGFKWEPRPGAEAEIMAKMSDIAFSLDPSEHLRLPPVVFNDVPVHLPKKVLAEYRAFERESVSETYDVEAVSRGVLVNKLLQFANGGLYRQEENKERETLWVHDAKLAALEQIVTEAAGKPVLVAYTFKFDLDRIRRKFPKAVVFDEDPNAVKKWNKGKIQLLLAHPASIGHGLNLQYGGHIAVWFGLTWSLELYLQLNKRLPRPGQPHEHVIIHRLIALDTADEDVVRALDVKGATQECVTKSVNIRLGLT